MKKTVSAFVDRIEGDLAVIYLGEGQDYKINIPLKFLPNDIKENTNLKFNISIDNKTGDDIAKEVEDLRKMLIDGS